MSDITEFDHKSERTAGGLRCKDIYKSDTKEKPLITIITCVYNGAQYIESAIQSVIEQSYGNIEYIIIDGKSTDNTLEIVSKYEDGIDYWISEPDSGIYDAMNKGIQLARGRLIGIINCDDWYERKAVELVVNKYKEDPSLSVIYGLVRTVKNNKEFTVESTNHEFLTQKMIPHPTCFVTREAYEKYGLFNTEYDYSADYDLFVRFKKNKLNFHRLDSILANFRLSGRSQNNYRAKFETIDIRYKNGYITFAGRVKAKIAMFGKNVIKYG